MSDLKEIRLQKKLTQQQVADAVGVSLRSYKSYENEPKKAGTIKYNYILSTLSEINPIDEEHGVLSVEDIKSKCAEVFKKHNVDYCYLFGSYAKEKATPISDVDLLISTQAKGIEFFGLVEEVRVTLRKKVDVLDLNQINNNPELLNEILKDGIKIYG